MLYAILGFLLAVILLLLLWPVRQHRKFCLAVGILFVASSGLLYGIIGSPGIVPLLEARQQRTEEIKASMLANAALVKKDPKNLQAWVALGQAFVETRQWDAASNAFKQAVLLSQGNPNLIMAYAKSMILGADGKISDEARKALEMVLLQEPLHEEARYYLAVRLLQEGKTQEAMQAMKKLYRSLPDDSPLKGIINEQIGR